MRCSGFGIRTDPPGNRPRTGRQRGVWHENAVGALWPRGQVEGHAFPHAAPQPRLHAWCWLRPPRHLHLPCQVAPRGAQARTHLHACLDWLPCSGGDPLAWRRVQPPFCPRVGCGAPRRHALHPCLHRPHGDGLQQVHDHGDHVLPFPQAWQPWLRPLSISTPANRAKYELSEVIHGRAAMMGFSGIIHQMIVTKQGTIAQLVDFKSVDPSVFKGLSQYVSSANGALS
eukprot:28565_4